VSSSPSARTSAQAATAAELASAINAFVDEYRSRCLWSLRQDYYPRTPAEQMRVLEAIERNGDLAAYRRASTLRQWLSRISSASSSSD
jgi:hypothetical protein